MAAAEGVLHVPAVSADHDSRDLSAMPHGVELVMGRWKMGPQGGYFDQNDSGPDQYTPTSAEAGQAQPAAPAGPPAYTPPMGGILKPSGERPMSGGLGPADKGMSLLPGQNASWSWNGSNGSGSGTLDQMLAEMAKYYGGAGMTPGQAQPAAAPSLKTAMPVPQTPSAAPRAFPSSMSGTPLGGTTISSRFGR